jgi:serine/threonine-protein kinase
MNQPAAHATSVDASERLESWKEIAAYLKRGVTTVQRWEREEGLPVHRQQHDSLGSVYAYKDELEAWRVKRALPAEADATDALTATSSFLDRRAGHWDSRVLQAGMLIAAVLVGAVGARLLTTTTPALSPVRHLTVVPNADAPIAMNGTERNVAITPDGKRIVYVGGPGASRILVRALDQPNAVPTGAVGSPRHPFVSPDSQWIGYFDGGVLKKVSVTGGPATPITEIRTADNKAGRSDRPASFPVEGAGARGATWGPNSDVFIAMEGGLFRLAVDGGARELLVRPDTNKGEAAYCWPEYVAGANAILFTILPSGDWSEKGSRGSLDNAEIAVLDLRTRQSKVLLQGASHAHYVESGHLVYAASTTLRAVPFDIKKLAVTGTPKTVVPQVAMSVRGAADFDVSRDGTLAYVPGTIENDLVSLMWVDRSGREDAAGPPPFLYRYPRLSPDGKRLALGSVRDLGVWDFATRKLSWFGFGPTSYPVWTPDGRRVIFSATAAPPVHMYVQTVDGTQPAAKLIDGAYSQYPNVVSPDGAHLVFREEAGSSDLMVLDLADDNHHPRPLVKTPFRELNADLSPDGKFVAYQSNESGQDEVYVQPFLEGTARRWVVSSGGGSRPMWSHSGEELFYVSPSGAMMSVAVDRRGTSLATGAAIKLFDGPYYFGGGAIAGRTYDISPIDGRFLMMKSVSGQPSANGGNIEVVLNWFEELRQTVRPD